MHDTPPSRPPAVVEIACDESGSEGEKLVGGTTDVFAHASLDVAADVAVACIDEVRVRARSPAEELKASVVLREQNRAVLEDLLGPGGPFHRHARVHLTDKELHLVGKLVELLGNGTAHDPRALHRDATAQLGDRWRRLLAAFNDLMRARLVDDARVLANDVAVLAHGLARAAAGTTTGDTLTTLARALPTDTAGLRHLLDKSRGVTVLDPLVPALAAAVAHWGADGRAVSVVHDEHRTLRETGLAHLGTLCGTGGAFAGIRFVDSRDDPRVQLADFLAGAARRIASDARRGQPDPVLTRLLRPYVDPASVWGERTTVGVLGPGPVEDEAGASPT